MTQKRIPIDLLIFDLDGTLTDSIPPAVEAIQTMIAELGLPYKTKEQISRHVGYGEAPLVSGAIDSKDPALLKKAMSVYFSHYAQDKIHTVQLYPHVREALEFFKNKTRIIVSNKKYEFIRIILDHHHLTGYFAEILGGDTSSCAKPDPCEIKKLLKKYHTPPRRALLIGDMTVDVETGKNAGIMTCAVTYGFDDRSKLQKAAPDFMIADLLELKDLIE
ncbi:HAD-IA family hydrolase [Candidatus Saganbacteria bacterium]|uniref:HAD-IA family hydrolase n=1 Tax=Candidatus Saganbacteria bacterium TaxID=2575572 RepID=A0A9D6UJF5_UNCSA|nr:HAD-IA family hydrolase [Candidatus Saganbacteria bacterium]